MVGQRLVVPQRLGENVLKELNELEEGGTVWDEANYMKTLICKNRVL